MLPSVGTWMVPSFRAPVAPVPVVSCQHCMVSDDPCTCSGLSLHVRWSLHMFWTFFAQIGNNFRSCYPLCSLVLSPARKQDCSNNLSRIKLLNWRLSLILCLPCHDFGRCCYTFFGTPCPGAITSLHFSHGHILVTWELDAGVYLGVCWICSERRSSCNVKAKALRASQLKDVKGKNLGDFWHQGYGLFFQGTGSSASQRVGVHKQLICNQTSLVNRNMWAIVSLFVDFTMILCLKSSVQKEMNTIDCQTHRA